MALTPAPGRSVVSALPRAARRYVVLVCLGAATVAVLLVLDGGGRPPGTASWLALPFLVVLQMVATYLRVTFRPRDKRREGDGVDLGEAVLAPLLFAFPVPAVLLAVATAHLGLGLWRRATPTKTAFNAAQFVLAAACAHLVLIGLTDGRVGVGVGTVGALVAALVAAALVNNVLFLGVLATASGSRPRQVLAGLRPVVLPGWVGGFALNAVMGLLFVLAYAQTPLATVLFIVPLVVLHSAYRGYAVAQTDRVRLAGLHAAAQSLVTPLDPFEAIDRYLAEVAACFDAGSAHLVLRTEAGREIYAYDAATQVVTVTGEQVDAPTLHGALAAQPAALRLLASSRDPAAALLAAAGHDNCLAAPLREEGRLAGAVIVFDQVGFDADAGSAEVAVLEALARETVSAFTRGRLVGRVLAEQRKLAEVVDATSDGIFSIATDGRIRSWNPAMERLTAMPADTAVGSATALAALRLRNLDGKPVDVADWTAQAEGGAVPPELVLDALDGTERRLQCSTSASRNDAGELRSLVVIARDATAAAETERLRQDVSRLAEQEAAQRAVVDHLQQAVMPARPDVTGADLAVVYEASEPTAPTGGDLYDWQVLSNGELHLVVLDVLGHGVSATRDALAVMHTLRVVALEGTPLEEIIARADALLAAQHPDLVATVVVARFDPATGALAVAAGGHPPALIVDARGGVEQLAPGGGAIGWPGAGSDGVAHAQLEPGDSLVLYTDGLVEARKNILEGLDDLVRHAAELAGRPAQDMAGELLARSLAGAERRDDSLALVLRRQPVAVLDDYGTWRIRPDVEEVSALRRRLQRWLRERAVDNDDDVALVAVELLSNAARHARGEVVLAVALDEDRVVLDVSDDGVGSTELSSGGLLMAPEEAEGGRGLFLVRALSQEVQVLSTDEGSVIRATVARSAPRLEQRQPL